MKALRYQWIVLMVIGCVLGAGNIVAADPSAPVVFDFVQKFPLAEIKTNGSLIKLNGNESSPLLGRGWADFDAAKGGRARWAIGDESTLRFFISQPADLPMQFRCTPFLFKDAPEQQITIGINGHSITQVRLRSRPYTYTVNLPASALRAGVNELTLRYAYSHAPQELSPTARDKRRLAVAWEWIQFGSGTASARPVSEADALIVPSGTRVDYFTKVGPETVLTVDDISALHAGDAPPSKLQVEVATGSGAPRHLTIPPADGKAPRSVPLGAAQEEVARVSFHAQPDSPAANSDGWRVVRPALRAPASAAPAAVPSSDAGAKSQRPNILIYLIDTLRADHLGCYGYQRPTSPRIDAFAREATLFRNTIGQSSHTVPTVTSIFSGMTPLRHGVHNKRFALPTSASTLAELLHGAGYATAGFITNGNISGPRGLDQGFETYDYMPENTDTPEVHQLSDRLNEHAFAWLDQRPTDRPFFVYMHATDPHGPYMPRSPYREQFARRPIDPMRGSLRKTGKNLTAADTNDLIDLYDAEVAFNDANFGALVDKLRALGVYDQTLIVFISDHGEEFNDHGGWFHGKTLYSEMIHVPLIMKLPAGAGAGREVTGVVQQIDVLPTLVEYVGETIPAEVEGKSVLTWLSGGKADPERPAYSHTILRRRERDSVVIGQMKLIRLPDGRSELYDLQQDPGEKINLISERDVTAGYLRTVLAEYDLSNPVKLPPKKAVMDDTLKERLRALGY